jgi:hypothetical protein
MSATTYVPTNMETSAVTNSSDNTQPSLFSRFVTALHYSRQLQAEREINRHRHLIESAEKRVQS